ncbi:MAG: hypothetical protein ACK4VP_07150, partial [Nitrospira sp.]
ITALTIENAAGAFRSGTTTSYLSRGHDSVFLIDNDVEGGERGGGQDRSPFHLGMPSVRVVALRCHRVFVC